MSEDERLRANLEGVEFLIKSHVMVEFMLLLLDKTNRLNVQVCLIKE